MADRHELTQQVIHSNEGLEDIRSEIVPQMAEMAKAQAYDFPDAEFASATDDVYAAFGSIDDMPNVPEVCVAVQQAMHDRLNTLVRKLGTGGNYRHYRVV